jgi:hypothetical protein
VPCFNTHWLVALQAIELAPDCVKAGKKMYKQCVDAYRKDLIGAINSRALDPKQTASVLRSNVLDAGASFARSIRASKATYDVITCFSAYMLGACGPDFWMLPSEATIGPIPDMADEHFDLGHYNRTHRQFELSICRVGGPGKTDLASLVQRAYFCGMATHVAADVVVHQLVNVSAGAYNLLEKLKKVFPDKTWQNEKWSGLGKNIWNTHNKVEHYWDTYVRYRYLGDLPPFWPNSFANQENWFPQLGFPTVDGLMDYARRNYMEGSAVVEDCKSALNEPLVKYAVERPLMFPQVFCDRVLEPDKEVPPFIYDIVVHPDSGAYPYNDVEHVAPPKAVNEKTSYQMRDPFNGKSHSERRKLRLFSTNENLDDKNTSFNYLTYWVGPDVERTKDVGFDTFFDLPALHPFLRSAVGAAGKFLTAICGAYDKGDPGAIGPLGFFWNLDTGLGLRVIPRHSDTDRECVTELDFVHVFDQKEEPKVGTLPEYHRKDLYCARKNKGTFATPKGPPVYPTYLPDKPFDNILAVNEPDDKAYLEEIKVLNTWPAPNVTSQVATCSLKLRNVRQAVQIAQRLNLHCKIAIADLKSKQRDVAGEPLAMFFLGDKSGPPGKGIDQPTRKWLAGSSRVLDYSERPTVVSGALQHFATHILVNTDQSMDCVRKIGACDWNNVVPYDKTVATHGRNFAISTGRRHVLKAVSGGDFNPRTDFVCYANISPTEHVFFTLFALALGKNGYYDLLTKEAVDAARIPELRRIDETGVVKIVLIYKFAVDGSLFLSESYVDGLQAKP